MHSNLNFHHSQASIASVSSKHLVKSLAESALKHVPGSEKVIEKMFSTKSIVPELQAPKAMNLVMHMGHTH